MRGICDLIALKDGVTIYIEVKAPKGKLSPHQEAFARKIDEHGGLFIVARNSGTVERAVKNLRLELCGKDGKAAIAITDHKGMKVATAGQ
jgi:Holliday junction resolvase-like predicted endonuclease